MTVFDTEKKGMRYPLLEYFGPLKVTSAKERKKMKSDILSTSLELLIQFLSQNIDCSISFRLADHCK